METRTSEQLLQQTLLIDADDTLWENNIYFDRAIASFVSYLDHGEHTPEQVREVLYQCERETIPEHGYGLAGFRRSLVTCFERVHGAEATPEQRCSIDAFAQKIADQQIELLDGVAETLPQLAVRHRLILVTKGDSKEQLGKLARSGIHAHFSAVEVPAEKHAAAYRDLVSRHGLEPATTWMIGNSPRSDVNPALAAGLHAVFIQHASTWVLEHDEIRPPLPPQRLLELESFAELLHHF